MKPTPNGALRFIVSFSFLFLLFIGCSGVGYAATWTVDPSSTGACTRYDMNCSTLGQAIISASSGDTLQVGAGIYTEQMPVVRKDLTIQGAGIGNTILDGGGARYLLHVEEGRTCTFEDMTLRNANHKEYGGALRLFKGAALTVNRCSFEGNATNFYPGGVLFGAPNGTAHFNDCTFTNNQTGFYLLDNFIIGFTRCTFTGNDHLLFSENNTHVSLTDCDLTDNPGLVIHLIRGGSLNVTGSRFERNGGAIRCEGGATTDIATSTFTNNAGGIANRFSTLHVSDTSLRSNGSGIYNIGKLTMERCLIADTNGGGLINYTGTVTLTNVTISGNHGARNGGGILSNGPLTLNHCTVVNNSVASGGFGAAIYYSSAPAAKPTVFNTIIANNTGAQQCDRFVSPISIVNSLGHNLSSDGSCFDPTANPTDQINTEPLLGPLQDNGGPTWTHALLPGSPAIDAADPASSPATDQRGEPRIVDGDGDGTALPDIGAYEYAP